MVHLYLKHILAHFHAKRHSLVSKPAMGSCPKDGKLSAFLTEMHMQECFVGITFHEVSCSSQFMGNFLHCWWGVILSDNGLIQWYAVQAQPYFSGWFYWIHSTVNPWCWFYLGLQDVFSNHVVQGHADGFFALLLCFASLHRGNSFTEPTLVTSLGSCWHWSCPWPFIL